MLFVALSHTARQPFEATFNVETEYKLPNLQYSYSSLEPYIDSNTMKVHYEGHHAAYAKKMNIALKTWREDIEVHWEIKNMVPIFKSTLFLYTECDGYIVKRPY